MTKALHDFPADRETGATNWENQGVPDHPAPLPDDTHMALSEELAHLDAIAALRPFVWAGIATIIFWVVLLLALLLT